MKLLVSPGMPRAGTSYLCHQLFGRNGELFNVPPTKETNFFNRSRDENEFRSLFPDYRENRYSIDYSPAYLISRTSWLDNIIRLPASEKKIILHLRNPVDQIFAHYLHDLKAHWGKRQYGDDVYRPLFKTEVLRSYLAKRAEVIDRMVSELGRENILVVNFHRDIPEPVVLAKRVGRFLNMSLNPFSSGVIGPGGWMPYYVYGGTDGVNIAIEKEIYEVPPRAVLLVNCNESELWTDIDQKDAANLIAGSSSWTKEITEEQFEVLYEYLRDDWLTVLEMLGEDEGAYTVAKRRTSNVAFVGKALLAKLPFQGDLASILPRSVFVPSRG